MWNLEGQTVRGAYFGLPVEGIVTLSRVKFGGTVQHTVELFFPITMFGSERTTVLLDANEITYIEYESTTACEFDT
jgi:hypothetical protein